MSNRNLKIEDSYDDVYSLVQDTLKDINSNLDNIKDNVGTFIKKHPFYTLLGAVAVGAAAGLASRAMGKAVTK